MTGVEGGSGEGEREGERGPGGGRVNQLRSIAPSWSGMVHVLPGSIQQANRGRNICSSAVLKEQG